MMLKAVESDVEDIRREAEEPQMGHVHLLALAVCATQLVAPTNRDLGHLRHQLRERGRKLLDDSPVVGRVGSKDTRCMI